MVTFKLADWPLHTTDEPVPFDKTADGVGTTYTV